MNISLLQTNQLAITLYSLSADKKKGKTALFGQSGAVGGGLSLLGTLAIILCYKYGMRRDDAGLRVKQNNQPTLNRESCGFRTSLQVHPATLGSLEQNMQDCHNARATKQHKSIETVRYVTIKTGCAPHLSELNWAS